MCLCPDTLANSKTITLVLQLGNTCSCFITHGHLNGGMMSMGKVDTCVINNNKKKKNKNKNKKNNNNSNNNNNNNTASISAPYI